MNYNDYKKLINAQKTNSFAEVKKLYEKYPDDERVKYLYAKILMKREYFDLGVKLLKELTSVYSNDLAALELGRYYRSIRMYSLALDYLNDITDYKVIDYAIFEIGYINFLTGNYDEAEKNYKLLMHAANSTSAIFQLARIEVSRGNYVEALNYLKKVNESEINYYSILLTGKVYVLLHNYLEAKETFLMLYGTASDSYAKMEMSKVFIREQNYDEAFNAICSIKDIRSIPNYEKMYTFLAKKVNSFNPKINFKKFDYDYPLNQIIKYDENVAKIKFAEECGEIPDFQTLKNALIPENKFENLAFYDTYIFELDNVTYRVNTLPNSKEIMYVSVGNKEKSRMLIL